MTTSLIIEPLDLLLFRDGKPFSAGDDHLARSIFPPLPSTLTGFIRTKLFLDCDKDWEKVKGKFGDIGGPRGYGDFRLCGFSIRKNGVDYVPVPGDILKVKDTDEHISVKPCCSDLHFKIHSNFPAENYQHLWAAVPESLEETKGFISIDSLFDCLCGEIPKKVLSETEFIERELRTSIEMNKDSHSAKEGQLFSVEFLRPKDGVAFHVRFDGVRWPGESGLDTLGGERRPVKWEISNNWQPPSTDAIQHLIKKNGRFKLVLLTPAVFDNGWQPGQRFKTIMKKMGIKARLVGAAVKRPIQIGGFDLKNERPKPMLPGAPAGSVYFYETQSGDASTLAHDLMFRCISDVDWEAGFGLAAVGSWSYA